MRRKAATADSPFLLHKPRHLSRVRIAVIRAEYNPEITHRLESKCLQGLEEAGIALHQVDCYSVPGCFEIPLIAQKIAAHKRHHALIALGAVIRGETLHFDLVARECARGVMEVALRYGVPVIFEVLATENRQDALRRAGNNRSNKGFEAAQSALAMLTALERIGD